MRRIKLFSEESSYDELEKKVNAFLETIPYNMIRDIQLQDCCNNVSVMVVYEEADRTPPPVIGGYDSNGNLLRGFDDIYKGENR